MVDSDSGRTESADELQALQHTARVRNLFHSVRRLLASEVALSHELGLTTLPLASNSGSDRIPSELLAASASPSAARLLELSDALQATQARASARAEILYRAHDLLTTGAARLDSGHVDQAIAALREAARLVPDSTVIAAALAQSETALQSTFEFAQPGRDANAGPTADGSDIQATEGLARARALAADGSLDAAIRLLRDLASELPARSDLAGALEQFRAQERAANLESPAAQIAASAGVVPSALGVRANGTPPKTQTDDTLVDTDSVTTPEATAGVGSMADSSRWNKWTTRQPAVLAAAVVLGTAGALSWALRTQRDAGPEAQTIRASSPILSAPLPETAPQVVETVPGDAGPSAANTVPPANATVANSPSGRAHPTRIERPIAPVGTSWSNREVATSTMGGDPFLAGKRPEESLVGWRIRSKELERQYAVGKEALDRADFPRAIAVFSAIVGNEPGYADAADLLAVANRGREERVSRLIDQAERFRQSGEYESAIGAYQQALELEPSVPDIAARISDTRRQMNDLGRQAFLRATVAYAFGLEPEARNEYAAAAQRLPAQASERTIAEARARSSASATAVAAWLSPPVSRLDLAEALGELRPYQDEAGRFAFNYPRRRWKVADGAGSTLVSLTDPSQDASVRIDAIRLKESLSLPEHAEAVTIIESRLIGEREQGATQIVARRPAPAVPLVILDYKRQRGGGIDRVRQYSCIRGQDLFRIVAAAPVDTFPAVEGAFDQLARSFAPAPAR